MRCTILFIPLLLFLLAVNGQVEYPYPVQKFRLLVENKSFEMAYMDVQPAAPNGSAVVLFHGKNFNGYYWREVIDALATKGYRVIVPDQPGWGRSAKPDLHYSFHLLASINKRLLDSLHLASVDVIGHSMGGMLATRFALLYPRTTRKLILENPIGLEDYRRFVPYQTLEKIYEKERKATYESYKKYQQSYYPEWKPAYEQYVQAQAESLSDTAFERIAWVNALTYQMIYEQPVCYEFDRLTVPVLLVIGQADRTIVGKDLLEEAVKRQHGQYPVLGRRTRALIKNARLVELPGVGHIPHVQVLPAFLDAVLSFLGK